MKIFLNCILVFIILAGCSVSDPQKNSPSSIQQSILELKIVNVSIYKSDSLRAQPELATVISDKKSLEELDSLIKKNGNAEVTAEAVKNIYVMQFQYEENGKVASNLYFFYVNTEDGKKYLKEVKWSAQFEFDKFHKEDKRKLIDMIGKSNWTELATQPF